MPAGDSAPLNAPGAQASPLPVAAAPANGPSLGKDGVLPRDFLDRIATGRSFAFVLPDGSQAEGTIELSDRDEQGIVWLQGRVTRPAAGQCFFQRQKVAGVAGPLVGHVRFDDKVDGWKVEPTEDLLAARFVPRHQDAIVCVTYEQAPAVDADKEEVTDFKGPAGHPTNLPTPPYQSVISLQSMPGATGVIYLDFDGETGPFPGWGDFNAAPSGASNTQIFDVWKMVCEDYQPFNLNITTDRKVFDEAPQGRRQHVIITPTNTAAPGSGGVAYVGSYNWGGDRVCWSFYTTGTSACAVISHEVGHTLGLSHDGRTPSEGYYDGHGSGATGWGPIMGSGYYSNLTQWSKGEYLNANNTQDDLAIISGNNNDLDYREDDTGDTQAAAKYLEILSGNTVSSEGFIGMTGDIDAFRFATSGGQTTLNVNTVAQRPNLDVLAEIVNVTTSAVVTSNNPDTGINATVSANLPAGEYLLRVRGTGRGNPLGDGYTNYGSLGAYTVSGSVAGGVQPYRFSLAENPATGATIGPVAARVNHGVNPVDWSIASGNGSGGFAINPATGALTVADPAVFDYELQSRNWTDPATLELFVSIADSANPSLSEYLRVVVTVTDASDPPRFTTDPFIGRPGAPDVPYAGTLTAADQDANSAVPTYSKVSGPDWLVVAANGTLTGNPTAADLGTNTFTVRATDSGGAYSDATLLISIVDVAVNPFWNNPAGGSWPIPGNWLNNGIANGSAQNGDFSTLDLTADATVTLDGARTIGGLKFGDTTPSHNWTLASGSGGTLTLAPASGSPVVSVTNQTATVSAVLAGTQGLMKTGAGILALTQANSLTGPVVISQGGVRMSTNTSLGSGTITLGDANTGAANLAWLFQGGGNPTNAITVSAQGTGTVTIGTHSGPYASPSCPLTLNRPVTIQDSTGDRTSFSGKISGPVGVITLTGGRVTFDKNTNDFVGRVIVSDGTIYQNNAAGAVPDATHFTMNGSGSRFRLNSNSETIGGLNGLGIVDNVTGSGNKLTVGGGNASGSFAGTLVNGSGTLNFAKIGTGTQTLGGASTYTGSTMVSGGTLVINGVIGGSGVTVSSGATLRGSGSITSGVTMGSGSTLAVGDATSGTLTLGGTVTLNASGTVALRIAKSGTALSSDRIALTGSSSFAYNGNLTVTLAPGSDAPASGDKFTLFPKTSGSFTGLFNTLNLPPPGTDLMWDTSGLLVDGSIVVISSVAVETPAFSPGGSASVGPKSVTISSITSGSTIVYTTDGSDPTTSATAISGTTPVGGISIPAPANITLKAFARKAGLADSPVVTATYVTVPVDSVNWTNPAGGSWPVTGNWLSGVVADGADIVARFDTLNLTANASATLDGARTLGGLKFGDTTPSHNWTLSTGSGGPLTLAVSSGSPVITVANQSATISTVLAGTQGLAKSGAGTLTLAAANTYTGGTTVSEGVLVAKPAADSDWTLPGGSANIASGATLKVDFTPQTTQYRHTTLGATAINTGSILDLWGTADNVNSHYLIQSWSAATGGGTIRLAGGGSIAVWTAAANPLSGFTGLLNIQSGRFACNINSSSTLGGNFDVSMGTAGKLDLRSGHFTIDALDGVSGSLVHKSWTGDTINLTIGSGGGNGSFAGVMSGSNYQIIKAGSGTQVLDGANTYSGTTSVNGGTLLVNGSLGNTATTVAAAGTLGGTGTIAGAVTHNGTLAPGSNGVGNFTVNNTLALAGGSRIAWQISDWTGAAGSGFDKVTATSLNITATSASPVVIRPADLALAHFSEANRTFVLVQTSSGITGFSADKFTVDTSGLTVPQGTWTVQQSGNNLRLAYTRRNTAPVFTGNPLTGAAGSQDVAYSGTLAATAVDPDVAEILVFAKDSGPAWLTVAANGALGGTPGASDTGAQSFVVRVTDSFGASATATLSIQVASAVVNSDANGNGILDTWETERFGDAAAGAHPAGDDPDHDGLSNLLEYALDTNPTISGPSPIVYDTVALGDGNHLRITIPKNPAATNLVYTVESSGAFDDWSSANTTIENNTPTQLIVRDNVADAASRFIRLRVETVP